MVTERKIVKSGNSSFIVSLPIEWIHKNKLGKGSTIAIGENEVGDLVITKSERRKNPDEFGKTIAIDSMGIEKISFEVFNAYIQNHQTILIEGKELSALGGDVRNLLGECIGLEVIEQDKKSFLVKNFTTGDDSLSPRVLLRKIAFITGETFTLLSQFIKEGFTQKDVHELRELVRQNNRLYLLARKTILRAIEDSAYIRIFQTTYHQITKDKLIAAFFNQTAFSLNSLGNVLMFIEHTKEDSAKLREMLDLIRSDYESLISNLRYKNRVSLGDLYERCSKNSLKVKHMLRETKNYFIIESSIYLSILIELIKRISFEISE